MTIFQQGKYGRQVVCCLTSCLLFALAACSSPSNANRQPTATATASLATAHGDWTTLTNTPAGAANVTFAPSNPRIGLLCTSVNRAVSTGQPKLYKTTDGGQSWQEVTGVPAIQLPSSSSIPLLISCNTFIDATDANDVFLQQIALNPAGAGVAVARALYRSRDGGATWGQPLGTLDRTNGFGKLAVVGPRLVATALPSFFGARGCSDTDPFPPAQPSTVLYASDDGGQTWQQIGQSIENRHLGIVGMSLMGTTVFALANTLFPGGCGNNFQPTTSLWKSSDGGHSWQQVTTPSALLGQISFTPRADGTGYYGVGLAGGPDVRPGAPFTVLFSPDSGATWSPVPGLDPSRTNITDPTYVQWDTLAVTPSGAVVAQVFQYPIPGSPSGIFAIRPSDSKPAWTSYAPVAGTQSEMTIVTNGTTLWALDFHGTTPTLKYLPLP